MEYLALKVIHIISATFLFGTGLGSAYYKWRADHSGSLDAIVHTNKNVVIADWIFTTPAVIIQPVTGVLLLNLSGYSLFSPWLVATYFLYMIMGLCWLPVIWLQIRMRDISQSTLEEGCQLTRTYFRHMKLWFCLGIPAFVSAIFIFVLMVFKPGISLW